MCRYTPYSCFNTNPYTQIRHPECHLPVFIYIFIGLAVLMLFANLIYAKVSLAYWTPEQLARLPIDAFGSGGGGTMADKCTATRCASFDEDISLTDVDLANYVSLGMPELTTSTQTCTHHIIL